MTSEANAKANFRPLRSSLIKEQLINDIESGHSGHSGRSSRNAVGPTPTGELEPVPSKPITSQSSLAKGVFSQIFDTIQEQRYHIDTEQRVVYEKLMDHLDDVEETHVKSTSILILIELVVFSGLLSALVCSLTMGRIKHQQYLRLRMWQYIAMVMMIASGLSVVRFVTFVVSWPVKRWWRIHKYVVYFIRQLKGCVDVTLWFCIVLTGWYLWFRPRLRHVHGNLSVIVTHQVTRFLIALCLGSFLWLLKNMLYLKLEADLHYDQLFERVQLSVIYLHFLQIIHKRGMWRFLPDNKTKKKLVKMLKRKSHETIAPNDQMWMQGKNIWMLVKEMEKASVPIWILRRLEEEYLDQVKLRPLPGNSNITKDDQKILKEAKKMFRQLIKRHIDENETDQHYSDLEIKREDIKEALYGMNEKELDVIFKAKKQEEEEQDDDESEAQAISDETPGERSICYDEFLNWAVRAYKNCWGLEQTLNSSKRVFTKLNRLLSAFLLMVMLIIWLLLSGIVDTAQLALLFTPFLAASFIFGDSCKKMFEGLIFAFAMHPFDVGDRVIINNVQMRVTELNILTSCFHKYDTGEEVIAPNSTLTTTSIINLDITPDQSDTVEFIVDAQTPLEDIKDLEIKIKKFLDDDIEYASNNKVVKSEIGKEEMKMIVYFKYLVSYLTAESKASHKSKILSMIIKFRKDMEKNKREYSSSYQPYTVEIDLIRKLKLKDIEDLQFEILRDLQKCYGPNSKVVVTELKKLQVKMAMYFNKSDHTKEEEDRKQKEKEEKRPTKEEGSENLQKEKLINVPKDHTKDQEDEKRPTKEEGSENRQKEKINVWKNRASTVLVRTNLEAISENLKRNSAVQEVTIRQPIDNGMQGEVIAHGGIVWGSFKPKDVIERRHNPAHPGSSTLETVHSGVVSEDHGNLFLAAGQVNETILDETSTKSE